MPSGLCPPTVLHLLFLIVFGIWGFQAARGQLMILLGRWRFHRLLEEQEPLTSLAWRPRKTSRAFIDDQNAIPPCFWHPSDPGQLPQANSKSWQIWLSGSSEPSSFDFYTSVCLFCLSVSNHTLQPSLGPFLLAFEGGFLHVYSFPLGQPRHFLNDFCLMLRIFIWFFPLNCSLMIMTDFLKVLHYHTKDLDDPVLFSPHVSETAIC